MKEADTEHPLREIICLVMRKFFTLFIMRNILYLLV
jgi:hypothetical protein